MVVVENKTIHDVVFVVEATAFVGAHIEEIYKPYIVPILELVQTFLQLIFQSFSKILILEIQTKPTFFEQIPKIADISMVER